MVNGCPVQIIVWLGHGDLEFLTYFNKLFKPICISSKVEFDNSNYSSSQNNLFLKDSLQFVTLGFNLSKVVFMTVTTILWKSDKPVSITQEI